MRNHWKKITVSLCTVFISLLVLTVGVHAASFVTYRWSDEPAVKAGNAWFRSTSDYDEETESYSTRIEMSRESAKKGFAPILTGEGLDGDFITDGTTLYFHESNTLKMYSIKSKKISTVKKLKASAGIYYNFHGYFNKKIWLLGRSEKFGAPILYSYNPKTKKFKTEKKNFLCFNAAATSRYLVICEGKTKRKTAAGATYGLKVYDKNTGKKKLLTKKGIFCAYASGGGGSFYESMGKCTVYGEYNKAKKVWQIKEYKFSKKKTYVLKSLKKNEKLMGLMWMGSSVRYSLSGDKTGTVKMK